MNRIIPYCYFTASVHTPVRRLEATGWLSWIRWEWLM